MDQVDGLLYHLLVAVGKDLQLTPSGVDVQSFQRVWVLALGALPKVAQDPPPKNPGLSTSQSAKVRTGTWCLRRVPALVVVRPRRGFGR